MKNNASFFPGNCREMKRPECGQQISQRCSRDSSQPWEEQIASAGHLAWDCHACRHRFIRGDRTGVAPSPAVFCLQPWKVSTGALAAAGNPTVPSSGCREGTALGYVTVWLAWEAFPQDTRRCFGLWDVLLLPETSADRQERCLRSSQGQAGEVVKLWSQLLLQQHHLVSLSLTLNLNFGDYPVDIYLVWQYECRAWPLAQGRWVLATVSEYWCNEKW